MKSVVKSGLYLLAFVLLGLIAFALRYPVKLQTSLTDLLPTDSAVLPKSITGQYASALNIVVQGEDFEKTKTVADYLYQKLTDAGLTDVTYQMPENMMTKGKEHIKRHQNSFLSPNLYRLLVEGKEDVVRSQAVQKIKTSWMPPVVPLRNDPFLLVSDYATSLPSVPTLWQEKNGVLAQEQDEKWHILMRVKLEQGDVYRMSKQINFIQDLIADKFIGNKAQVHLSGAPAHTVKMFRKSKREISFISLCAILTLLFLTYRLFESKKALLCVGLNLIVAFGAGCLGLLLFCSQIHMLSLAFGASLVGICVDYSFHRFWNAEKDELFFKNIRDSFLTTLCCFAPLLFSPFPLLYQVALFTIFGLTGTFFWVWKVPIPSIEKQEGRIFAPYVSPLFKVAIFACFAAIAGAGMVHFKTNYSPLALYTPDEDLQKEEKLFANLNKQQSLLIVRGDTLQSVLEKEEILKQRQDFFSLSTLMPSLKRQGKNHALIQKLYKNQSDLLASEAKLAFKPTYQETSLVDEKNFSPDLYFLMRQFIIQTEKDVWTITPFFGKKPASFKPILERQRDIIFFEPGQYLTDQLRKQAIAGYILLTAALLLLFLLLCSIYRLKAFKYILPSLAGCVCTLCFLCLWGYSITFFHWLCLFMVMGLGMDYTIFMFNRSPFKPVLFSFLSSFIGFGLLSFVSFNMIALMGKTIALGLLLSFFFSLIFCPPSKESTYKTFKNPWGHRIDM